MKLLYLIPVSFILLVFILRLIKSHVHILPPNTYAIEEYYSIPKDDFFYRISIPNKPFISLNTKLQVKYFQVPSGIQYLHCKGILDDFTQCTLRIGYNISLIQDKNDLEHIYKLFPNYSKSRNAYSLTRHLELHFNSLIREFLCHYSYSNLRTTTDVLKFKDELVNILSAECLKCLKIDICAVQMDFDFPAVFEDIRKPANMDIESLTNADYNMQQINQILKANNDGIILSSISPIVPEGVFRKIREKYNDYKEKFNVYIEQLSIITKTQEEINKICEEIMQL